MDDLDRKLYDIFSLDNIKRHLDNLRKEQENAETETDKFIIGLDIEEWERILKIGENKKE